MADADVLKLNAELSLQRAEYWHEIDVNLGRGASAYYTDDAEFHGQFASYHGKAKIQQFYDWRVQQGPRLAVHCFTNFRAWFTGARYCRGDQLSVPVREERCEGALPSHPPITISLATDPLSPRA